LFLSLPQPGHTKRSRPEKRRYLREERAASTKLENTPRTPKPRPTRGAVRSGCHHLGIETEPATMDDRMDAIRLKEILGEPLTEQELMCLQMEQHGFGCHACFQEPRPGMNGASSST